MAEQAVDATGGRTESRRFEGPATLSEAFWRVARRLRSASTESLARWEIAPSHARALMVLGRHQPRRPGDLAAHLHIAPRSATEVIDALQERGLVHRQPDPSDRRATLVELTDDGHRVLDDLVKARESEADAYFARLSSKDRQQLGRILGRLLEDEAG